VLNAGSAREKGARVLTRTRFEGARRVDGLWEASLRGAEGAALTVQARAIVNAAGPWVMDVLDHVAGEKIRGGVRLVKGSHIIVPKVHSQGHAYILQNHDRRVIFVIPYERDFSLIGTTDVAVGSLEGATTISADETRYLLDAVNRFLAKPLTEADIVSSYAGVRPLYDDGSPNPSEVTRDYVLRLDDHQGAPLLTVFGGKITTYRRLAEEALAKLKAFFPAMKGDWTAGEALPGGDVGRFNAFRDDMYRRYDTLGRELVDGVVRRHGSRSVRILDNARASADLGRYFGGGLTEAEVRYLVAEEWAETPDDVLWRRTKCALHMTPAEREGVAAYLQQSR
jgi:glycerol-3-phosphate dehydrogenase